MENLIGSIEAAKIIGIDRAKLLRWVRTGRVTPAMKLPDRNGAYLFHRVDAQRLADKLTAELEAKLAERHRANEPEGAT